MSERHQRLPLRAALRCTLRYPNKSNHKRFCLPYSTSTMDLINAQMVKLLAIQDKVAQMATYVAQISPFLAIPDNQAMLNSHDAGSELFQAASSGNVLMVQALLSANRPTSILSRQKAGHRSSLMQKRDTLLLLRSSLL